MRVGERSAKSGEMVSGYRR